MDRQGLEDKEGRDGQSGQESPTERRPGPFGLYSSRGEQDQRRRHSSESPCVLSVSCSLAEEATLI